MQKLGRVRQEPRLDPGPLNQFDYIVLYIHQVTTCLEAIPTRGLQPNNGLKVPGSSQAGSQISR